MSKYGELLKKLSELHKRGKILDGDIHKLFNGHLFNGMEYVDGMLRSKSGLVVLQADRVTSFKAKEKEPAHKQPAPEQLDATSRQISSINPEPPAEP